MKKKKLMKYLQNICTIGKELPQHTTDTETTTTTATTI